MYSLNLVRMQVSISDKSTLKHHIVPFVTSSAFSIPLLYASAPSACTFSISRVEMKHSSGSLSLFSIPQNAHSCISTGPTIRRAQNAPRTKERSRQSCPRCIPIAHSETSRMHGNTRGRNTVPDISSLVSDLIPWLYALSSFPGASALCWAVLACSRHRWSEPCPVCRQCCETRHLTSPVRDLLIR